MFKKKHKLQDVFGQPRDLPLNYVERENIDSVFKESLQFNKHVVIYGSSKQGKTSLRKHNISEDEYILIHCSNKWDIGKLNAQILKQAGFKLQVSSSRTLEGKAKVSASINLFSLFENTNEIEGGGSETKEFRNLELDPYDSNDIIDALESINFKKIIVLEDFHYLKEDTQKDFAFELKAFHENSDFTFLIVGVWLEHNRLTLLNGDLTGRIISINADKWSKPQLREVISKGEKLLNVEFSNDLKNEILKWCTSSVYITQELCLRVCVNAGIKEKQSKKTPLNLDCRILDLTKEIINQQTGRYNSFLRAFYHGFQENELHMHRWLLYPILMSNTAGLVKGISYRQMKERIISKHPRGNNLNLGNLTTSLNSAHSLQVKKNIKPNILDYDQTNSILNIVDRAFIVWLIFQDNIKLLKTHELPFDVQPDKE